MKTVKIKNFRPSRWKNPLKDDEKTQSTPSSYNNFHQIDGRHSFQTRVLGAFVPYYVRGRKGGEVIFFNFDLAKEMGLIPSHHTHDLNKNLVHKILETFGIVIINEYDIINNISYSPHEVHPYPYMATRYLQLQHPSKKGKTSGDGRSIWNGEYEHNGTFWDITSCGTGATCLSPATAIEKRFFKTGDPTVSYGCGSADPLDGISAALMSEIFHRNQIETERTLAVIRYDNNNSINVRAGKNLLRPSHFFCHLKQNHLERLKAVTDYYIDRQIQNKDYPPLPESEKERYSYFLKRITKDFAEASAKFEREYIFCWMGWDGDNILVNGGIIDYGSVRQFGLFHHRYRYDDVDRFSTTLTEQKNEAKYIVQTFAQVVDFILNGKKQNIKRFSNHSCLKDFDSIYQKKIQELLLHKMGFNSDHTEWLLRNKKSLVQKTEKLFSYFERQVADKKEIRVEDGVTRHASYSMRDLLRELPQYFLKNKLNPIEDSDFLNIIKSQFTKKNQLIITPSKHLRIKMFQACYKQLLTHLAQAMNQTVERVLLEICMRSSLINQSERVTGDSAVFISQKLLKENKHLTYKEFYRIFKDIVFHQILLPEFKGPHNPKNPLHNHKLIKDLIKIIKDNREGL